VVFLAQIAAVGVPEAAQATLKVEADAKPAALVLAAALLWLGGPMLLLFAWLSGLTAVPSCFAMLRSLEADRLRAAEAAKRDAELKLSVLAAQIEPHFLFNTLAGMRGAVLSEPARAVAMIDRLAEYLRLTIPRLRDDGSSQNARLEAQFDIAAAYLGLMQARLPRLHYRLDLPDALRGAAFPPLMLISLVENAVKHGVEPKSGEALITVTAHTPRTTAGELLQVTVSDNGVGFQQGHGGGVGLTNIRARLEQLYGARGSLALEQRPEGGVQAAIQVPLRWADQEVATGMSKEVA
jgi:sensor histidine kinase YesM